MSLSAAFIDRMTGIILDGYVNTANKGEHSEAQEKVKAFLNLNLDRLVKWAEEKPGKRPPVYFNHQTGECIWLTRSQRRKMTRRIEKDRQRRRA